MQCSRKHHSRGYCQKHYDEARKAGLIKTAPRRKWANVEERFWDKVDKSGECWVWTASTFKGGYGCFRWSADRSEAAHRVALKLEGQTVPADMQVDHICFTRRCVRPDHLRLATNKQNNEHLKGALSNNRSTGVRGVTKNRQGVFVGQIGHNGQHIHVGRFRTLKEAEKAVIKKRNELFSHNYLDKLLPGNTDMRHGEKREQAGITITIKETA